MRALYIFQTQRTSCSLYLKVLYLKHDDTFRCHLSFASTGEHMLSSKIKAALFTSQNEKLHVHLEENFL